MGKWTRRYDLLALQWSNIPLAIVRSPLIKDPGAKLLVGELLSWAWKNGGRCSPSQEVVAWHLSTTVRSVQRWLRDLRELGVIKVIDRRAKMQPNEIIFAKDLAKFCTPERLDNRRKVFGPAMARELAEKTPPDKMSGGSRCPHREGGPSRHRHREAHDARIGRLTMPASCEADEGKQKSEVHLPYKASRRASRVALSEQGRPSVRKKKSSSDRKIALIAMTGGTSVRGGMGGKGMFFTSEGDRPVPPGDARPGSSFKGVREKAEARARKELGIEAEKEHKAPAKKRTARLLKKGWTKLAEPQKCGGCGELSSWQDPEKNIRHPRESCRQPAQKNKPSAEEELLAKGWIKLDTEGRCRGCNKKTSFANPKGLPFHPSEACEQQFKAKRKAKNAEKKAAAEQNKKENPQRIFGFPSGLKPTRVVYDRKTGTNRVVDTAKNTDFGWALEFFCTPYAEKWKLPATPPVDPRIIPIAKKVIAGYRPDDLEKMARLLVMDWDAIRDTYWKARDRGSKPSFSDFIDMHEFLYSNIEDGVESQQFRGSDYKSWIDEHCPSEESESPKKSGKTKKKRKPKTLDEALGIKPSRIKAPPLSER